MEPINTQITETPAVIVKSVKNAPIMVILIAGFIIALVLFIEAYHPGLLTGPVRRGLMAVGLKSA